MKLTNYSQNLIRKKERKHNIINRRDIVTNSTGTSNAIKKYFKQKFSISLNI